LCTCSLSLIFAYIRIYVVITAAVQVSKGTPQSILSPAVAENPRAPLSSLNLFLCYPDQGSEVGLPSLDAFQTLTDEHNNCGQGWEIREEEASGVSSTSKECAAGVGVGVGGGFIVHVGELLVTGCISGAPQAPWGRTSSADFQQRLYSDYHCVLTLPLVSFPFSRDFLTVWKRTVMFDAQNMEFDDDNDGDEDSGDEEDEGEEESDSHQRKKRKMSREDVDEDGEDEEEEEGEEGEGDDEDEMEENEDEWADIPADERLPHTMQPTAAPCMQHLLP
jgi:hypothetical protein